MSTFESFYLLDDEDRILAWGGPSWERHAQEALPEAPDADLTGRRLYDYVAGHFTRRFLRAFLSEARRTATGLRRTYRCDSTRLKRLMEMHAYLEGGCALRVTHWLIEEAPMPREIAPANAREPRLAALHRCSLCNRLRRRRAREWREPDAVTPPLEGAFWVIHSICKDCQQGVRARLPMEPPSPPRLV